MLGSPRYLKDFRPAAGLIKADYGDFDVEEEPLYPFDGEGSHTYFLVEKAGLSTMQAIHGIAAALGVMRRDIGYAGLKDARAVTRQWMSLEHAQPERIAALSLPRIRILETTQHRNKLRLGHLGCNRFLIKVRQTETRRLAELQDALALLSQHGVPNYFGQQRFGSRGDNWEIGRAIVRGKLEDAVDLVLGRASEHDHGDVRRARKMYDKGLYEEAARTWPAMFRDARRAARTLAQTGKKKRAFMAIDRNMRQFYISAYQSHLFNRVVAERLPSGLGQLWEGDLAWIHANGAAFRVVDASVEQPRADAFEISPTGPLFGFRMTPAEGRAGEFEAQLLAEEELSPQAFKSGPLRIKGMRRPLRFRPRDASIELGADEHGEYLALRFALPRGCYATALLRELFDETSQGTESDDERESEDSGDDA